VDSTVQLTATRPSKVTFRTSLKSVPVMTTDVPPSALPVAGTTDATVGAGGGVVVGGGVDGFVGLRSHDATAAARHRRGRRVRISMRDIYSYPTASSGEYGLSPGDVGCPRTPR
jgi:hypothetical protein